jgi:hypothetical protein
MLVDLKPEGASRRLGPALSERVWRTVMGKTTSDPKAPVKKKSRARRKIATPPPTAKMECLFTEDDD